MMVMRCVQVHIEAALRDAGIQHVVSEDADYGYETSPSTCIREVNNTDIYKALRCLLDLQSSGTLLLNVQRLLWLD